MATRGADEEPLWIPAGQEFRFEDLVHWKGKGEGRTFASAAAEIDIVVSGPHAGAAFPEELRPFISPVLTRRKQHDYSDVATGPVGRAWAARDSRVVFVECPHHRVVLDPNRKPPEDLEAALRECYQRIKRTREGEAGVALSGVDAVRPITFSWEDVLVEPSSDEDWARLVPALNASAALGTRRYAATLEAVLAAVLEARPEGPLTFMALHDTRNFKMNPDGSITVERPPVDRMPTLVNFGNRGDAKGDGEATAAFTSGAEMRRIAAAWAQVFGVDGQQDFLAPAAAQDTEPISFNRPYAGGYECNEVAQMLAKRGAKRCTVFQVEFERAVLLGPAATAECSKPGASWPPVDEAHTNTVAAKLQAAHSLLREAAGAVSAGAASAGT